MRFAICLLLFPLIYVQCKNSVKKLTESMGQEIIEMGAIKELPPGLDEEPSAEFDDDENSTSTTLQPLTKRDSKRTNVTPLTTQSKAEATKDEVLNSEEEETRIEKELADIYKDTDYKSEPTKDVSKRPLAAEKEIEKPIARARTNFKFQPDVNDRADVERFRTSVDEISCEKRVTQRLNEVVNLQAEDVEARQEPASKEDVEISGAALRLPMNTIAIGVAFLTTYACL